MDWTLHRKLKYIAVVAGIIIVILGYFIYKIFFTTPATCFDNKKNQNERGVDCGGVCELMCTADARPLIPLWTRPVNITSDIYSVVSYIENQNVGYGVQSVPYEIRMYDERNILIGDPITGTTFIGPNDRTAIFETAIKIESVQPKTAFLRFLETPIFYRTNPVYNNQNIIASRDIFSDLDTVPKLSVDITNVSDKNFQKFPVVVIVYDVQGNVLAVSQTMVDSLVLEETKTLYFSWPEPFSGEPARREIIPRINPFN
jgi:hypothetical protein